MRVWNAATGQPITDHTDWARVVAIGQAGDRDIIVSGGSDQTVRMWDATTGEPLTGHTSALRAVAIGRDTIASGGSEETVLIWESPASVPIFVDLLIPVASMAVDRDTGRLYVSGAKVICVFQPQHRPPDCLHAVGMSSRPQWRRF